MHQARDRRGSCRYFHHPYPTAYGASVYKISYSGDSQGVCLGRHRYGELWAEIPTSSLILCKVCVNDKDIDYLTDECADGRRLGFSGKVRDERLLITWVTIDRFL